MRTRTTLRFALEGVEGALVLAGAVITWPVSRRWLLDWGSRADERERRWPGDDLIAERELTITRAVTVRAPAPEVWQRIVQFGLDRAGFYSYELLERLGGIPVTNVESVESAWQSLAIGEEVLLHPKNGIRVSRIDEGRHLCFGKRTFEGKDVSAASWSFYLEPESDCVCRLVLRGCFGPPEDTRPSKRLAKGVERALDFVMEQRMLRTIKRLSENADDSP